LSVRKIHCPVYTEAIVGFDNDLFNFEAQTFIQKSGIVTAMVGILNAAERNSTCALKREAAGEDKTGIILISINFIPK
jgi:hypothetical protein